MTEGDYISEALNMRRLYRKVFMSPDGKKVLHHLCKSGCVLSSAFTAGSEHKTAYDNGARDLVLGILRTLHRDDADLQKQLEELYQTGNEQPITV